MQHFNSNTQDKITVSVCIITYNHNNYIEQAVKSVCEQETVFNFEVIIGDDASTDGTTDKLKKLSEKYKNIKLLIQSENKGGSYNYIHSNLLAKGEFVAYLDGDDYWLPNKLQKQYDFLINNTNYSAVATQKYNLFFDDTLTQFENKENYINKENIFSLQNLPAHCSLMFRSNMRTLLSLKSDELGNDLMILLDLVNSGPIYIIDEYLSVYRNGVGISSNPNSLKTLSNSFENVFNFALKSGYSVKVVEAKRSLIFLNFAYQSLSNKQNNEFKYYCNLSKNGVKYTPLSRKIFYLLRYNPRIARLVQILYKKFKY